jgi:ABC-2 type transport system permease protein
MDAVAMAARLSAKDYRALYSPRVYAFGSAPRAVLQALFFTYVAYAVSGPSGRAFALVGASVQVMVLSTVIKGSDVLVEERIMGTQFRNRLSVVPLWLTAVARWWVFVVEGVVSAVLAGLLGGLLCGEARLGVRFAATLPLLVLLAVTTSALGMAIAAWAVATRSEAVLPNFVAYLLLVVGGVVVPLDRLGPLAAVAHWLPLTNGLSAVRAAVDGRPWLGHAAAEMAVGAAWLTVAVFTIMAADRKARQQGADDLF